MRSSYQGARTLHRGQTLFPEPQFIKYIEEEFLFEQCDAAMEEIIIVGTQTS